MAAGVPPELDALILASLAKDPVDRPTATTLWEKLDALAMPHRWDQHRAQQWWEQHEPRITDHR
jgi:hypothetical protein